MPLTINAEKVIHELRKPITNIVSSFSYKYSGEKATSASHMVMPFSTLLEKCMPQMLQVGFFLFCFIFPFHMLLDMCISSISHHISSREKAESDSGAPQSEKTGT